MYFTLNTILLLASTLAPVFAHSASPLHIRQAHEAHARRSLGACASNLRARDTLSHRAARRSELVGKHLGKRDHVEKVDASEASVDCLLTPESIVGPYYLPRELVRPDIREGQPGVELLLDFKIVDVNTCQPLKDVMVDFWHANSTGVYSGFQVEGTEGQGWGRGLQPTDEHGIVHMTTMFPGWYEGRATHIHIATHHGGRVLENGTYASTGNETVSHVGQVYFDEATLGRIDNMEFYKDNQKVRQRNEDDQWFMEGNSTKYDAVAKTTTLRKGKGIEGGLLACITVGVDLKHNRKKELYNPAS
ncbi:Intradiol ring-cleavage dioxygenase [Geopyxis carbonaria]|nr:Intradiol ring-cleavage dioxygenase [Geopyxis carbonaria]